jgi:integral membrane protein (TIGR01906 family)
MKTLKNILLILLILSLPFLLVITSIRVVLSPLFIEVEYRLPGFPDDPFGFTFGERLQFARLSADYLVNSAPLDFLADIRMANGQPLYSERELSHMLDVKNLTQAVLQVWYLVIALFAFGVLLFSKSRELWRVWQAVRQGGWLTIGLVAAILLGVLLSFNELFTAFHRIFFSGDTWLFNYSDSLIRLFPLRFWMDVFLFIGGFSILFAVLAIVLGRRFSIRK